MREYLDEIINVGVINMYGAISRHDNPCFGNFNPKKSSHMLALDCMTIAATLMDKNPVYVQMGALQFLLFKIKYKKYNVKRYRKKYGSPINVDEILNYMTEKMNLTEEIYDLAWRRAHG